MREIESYNSSYPLAYYEIGNVYSFYGLIESKGTPASVEAVQKYASVLRELIMEEEKNVIKPVRGASSGSAYMNRFYAVVIGKIKSDKNNSIRVMFCNKHDGRLEYYTRKYSVDRGCKTDGQDLMSTSSYLGFESKFSGKKGRITLADREKKVGGITRANSQNKSTASIGGITRASQSNTKVKEVSQPNVKVGGITLVREQKIGGITRVKNPDC